jgi:hypothetical protein
MQWVSFTNPQYVSADEKFIDVQVVLQEGDPAVAYTCSSEDPISADLYAAVVAAGNVAPMPAPSLAVQAVEALAAGLTIELSGSLTLAPTVFPVDPDTQQKIGLVVTNVNALGSFPGGATSYPLKDVSGTWHTFTVPQYKAVAAAIAAYAAPLILIIDGNPFGATELPPSTVSLTV